MQWKAPALFLCLAGAILALLWTVSGREERSVPAQYVSMEPVTIAVATDPHFLAPALTDYGACFTDVITHADGKLMQESEALVSALFARIAEEQPDVLILSGDLTFNGER